MKTHLILCLLILTTNLKSQNSLRLSEEDKMSAREKAKMKVDDFIYLVSKVASSGNKADEEEEAALLLALFDKNAIIEVAPSSDKKNSYNIGIEEYVHRIKGYDKKYKTVVVSFDAVKVGNFIEKKDNNGISYYEATYEYTLNFLYSNEASTDEATPQLKGNATVKTGIIKLKRVQTRRGFKWVLLLGNTKVKLIKKL